MNLPMFILQCRAVDACKKAANNDVGKPLRRAEEGLALDEGLDLFALEGTHDRANRLFLARLDELVAEKRAAA